MRPDHYDSIAERYAKANESSLFNAYYERPAMLALAGFPATAGFIGKFYLIEAAVDDGYTWLAVFIVVKQAKRGPVRPMRGVPVIRIAIAVWFGGLGPAELLHHLI